MNKDIQQAADHVAGCPKCAKALLEFIKVLNSLPKCRTYELRGDGWVEILDEDLTVL